MDTGYGFANILDKTDSKTFQTLVENFPEGIFCSDLQGKFLYGNKRAEQIIGYKQEELIGKSFLKLKLLNKSGLTKAAKILTQSRKGKATGPNEFVLRRKDHKEKIVEINTVCINDDRTKTLLGMVQDITERKRNESDLIKNEEKYRLITDSTDDLIALTTFSLNPIYTYVSPSHERLLGYSQDELIGHRGLEFIHPDDLKNIYPILKNYLSFFKRKILFEGKQHFSEMVEFRAKAKSGEWKFLESTVNFSGKDLLFVSKDITDKKLSEQKIAEQTELLSAHDGVTVSIAESLDLIIILTTIQKHMIRICNNKTGPLFALYHENENEFEIKLTWRQKSFVQTLQMKLGISLDGRRIPVPGPFEKIAFKQELSIIDDITQFIKTVLNLKILPDISKIIGAKCVVYIPLWTKGKLVGGMFHFPVQEHISEEDLSLFSRLGNQAAIAIDNARLYQEAQDDRDNYKNILTQLEESEHRFSVFFEETKDCFYMSNKSGALIHLNPASEDIFGYTIDEFKKLSAQDLYIDIEDRHTFLSEIEKKGFVKDYIQRFHKKDGSEIVCMETSVRRKSAASEEPIYQGIIRDVTEQIHHREELELALNDAKRAEKLKNNFLANMSHEIRTPLNSILGFSDLFEGNLTNTSSLNINQQLELIGDSSHRLLRTINEIIDIAQIEAGEYVSNFEKVNLNNLVVTCVEEFVKTANAKDLKLEYILEKKSPYIEVDKYALAQSLTSLLDNAIKYTVSGNVTVLVKNKKDLLTIEIRDTGIGIDPKHLNYIFEPFSQESEGYSKKYQGIGLGLALTKRYLSVNNLPFDVKSKKGVGTTFRLFFKEVEPPLAAKDEMGNEKEYLANKDMEKKISILVVDDDLPSQKLVNQFLNTYCGLQFASTVDEAKSKLKTNLVDLMLLDLSLEGDNDGLDLARYIRANKKWKDIPIIAVTAHASAADRKNCLAAGCNDYLVKPIRKRDLREMVLAYYPRSQNS